MRAAVLIIMFAEALNIKGIREIINLVEVDNEDDKLGLNEDKKP